MEGFACHQCAIKWPYGPQYRDCPQCLKPCHLSHSAEPPLSLPEAESLLKHARFQRFYDEHERDRLKRGDPSPDVLGRLDGERAATEIRELDARAAA